MLQVLQVNLTANKQSTAYLDFLATNQYNSASGIKCSKRCVTLSIIVKKLEKLF